MAEQRSPMVLRVDGYELQTFDGDDTPRIRDIDLAERLEYERPRDYLSAQLKVVEAIARQSATKDDFWRRMEREYAGGLLQLSMGSGAA